MRHRNDLLHPMKLLSVLVAVCVVSGAVVATTSVSVDDTSFTIEPFSEVEPGAAVASPDTPPTAGDRLQPQQRGVAIDQQLQNSEARGRTLEHGTLSNHSVDRTTAPRVSPDQYRRMSAGDEPTVGTSKSFPTLNHSESEFTYRPFTLRAVTANSSVWVAKNLSFPANDSRANPSVTDDQLEHLSQAFESTIYPSDRRLFGAPTPRFGTNSSLAADGTVPASYYQSPDNESRTVILVDNIRDENYYNESYPVFTAGFYSPVIQNETDRNVVTIDAAEWDERLGPMNASWRPPANETNESDSEDAFAVEGTLTHEYQHLIHNDQDSDETSWVNEGLSDYAEYAAGYGLPSDHVQAFENRPNNSLVEWGDQGDKHILADYGGAALFHVYFAQQYGEDAIKRLIRTQANGIDGFETVLDGTAQPRSFYQLYQDFATALVVDSASTSHESDRYQFDDVSLNVSVANSTNSTETTAWGLQATTLEDLDESLLRITANGSRYQPVAWETTTPPTAPNGSNESVLWSGSSHLRDEMAIMPVDLRDTSDPTLSFETMYNIEQGWDVGAVQVSTDGGESWESLSNQNTTEELAAPESAHPAVARHHPGFAGDTNGHWVRESFDLSAYQDQSVLVSFRYLTDWATAGNDSNHPGTGWYLRNVRIPDAGVSHTGGSTAPFVDLSAVRDQPSRYQFTAIASNDSGGVAVEQFSPTLFTRGEPRNMNALFDSPPYDRVVVVGTWAARTNETGTVPYSVELTPFSDVVGPDGGDNGAIDGAEHRKSVG